MMHIGNGSNPHAIETTIVDFSPVFGPPLFLETESITLPAGYRVTPVDPGGDVAFGDVWPGYDQPADMLLATSDRKQQKVDEHQLATESQAEYVLWTSDWPGRQAGTWELSCGFQHWYVVSDTPAVATAPLIGSEGDIWWAISLRYDFNGSLSDWPYVFPTLPGINTSIDQVVYLPENDGVIASATPSLNRANFRDHHPTRFRVYRVINYRAGGAGLLESFLYSPSDAVTLFPWLPQVIDIEPYWS